VADGFTKALPARQFEEFKHNLNLKDGWNWGGVLNTVVMYVVYVTC
jgi:hypothetical protein